MKILHTADIHLREYGDERWDALQKLIEIGKEEKIGILVISGDLFDKGINAENLRPKIREIFSDNGFKIILIPGNHDQDSYKGGLYFGEDTAVLSDSPISFDDLRIIGIPFEVMGKEDVLRKLRSLKPVLTSDKKNILLFHGELLDAFFSRKDFGEEGEGRYMPVKLSYFNDLNVNYVLAGHFHSKFDVRKLENGGYFVYPGSPVSITQREVGRRKVNVFEVGKTPQEYPIDTHHFEEVIVELDPFKGKHPLEIIKNCLKELHPKAKAILTVKGYINGKELQLKETELVSQIKEVTQEKCIGVHYEFKDIQTILEDDIFKSFIKRLEQVGYEKQRMEQMRNITIKALMEAKL
jgi:DNA repair exonuclease SbcCD nuclease subunit